MNAQYKKIVCFVMNFLQALCIFFLVSSASKAEVKMVTNEVSPYHHNIVFSTQGFVKAGQETEISSQVAGKVVALGDGFEPGQKVKKDDLLFSVESSNYIALLATAKKRLADAELALADEKSRSRLAKRNWSKTNKGSASALVGRELHVDAAQASFDAEKINVFNAKKDVERANITAPYDGVIQRRDISLGTFVQVGAATGLLLKSSDMVIDLPVMPRYLQHINDLSSLKITLNRLNDFKSTAEWSAAARAFSPMLAQNDQRILLRAGIEFSESENVPLFINQYLKAEVTIPVSKLLFAIPESAFTQRESILFLEDGELSELYPEVIYEYNGKKYSSLEKHTPLHIVTESPDLFWSGAKSQSLDGVTE